MTSGSNVLHFWREKLENLGVGAENASMEKCSLLSVSVVKCFFAVEPLTLTPLIFKRVERRFAFEKVKTTVEITWLQLAMNVLVTLGDVSAVLFASLMQQFTLVTNSVLFFNPKRANIYLRWLLLLSWISMCFLLKSNKEANFCFDKLFSIQCNESEKGQGLVLVMSKENFSSLTELISISELKLLLDHKICFMVYQRLKTHVRRLPSLTKAPLCKWTTLKHCGSKAWAVCVISNLDGNFPHFAFSSFADAE